MDYIQVYVAVCRGYGGSSIDPDITALTKFFDNNGFKIHESKHLRILTLEIVIVKLLELLNNPSIKSNLHYTYEHKRIYIVIDDNKRKTSFASTLVLDFFEGLKDMIRSIRVDEMCMIAEKLGFVPAALMSPLHIKLFHDGKHNLTKQFKATIDFVIPDFLESDKQLTSFFPNELLHVEFCLQRVFKVAYITTPITLICNFIGPYITLLLTPEQYFFHQSISFHEEANEKINMALNPTDPKNDLTRREMMAELEDMTDKLYNDDIQNFYKGLTVDECVCEPTIPLQILLRTPHK